MKNVKFITEPGYVYDLLFLFVLHFNKDFCLTNMINYNQSAEDTEYLNHMYMEYESISDDLLPFFYIQEDGRCFMTENYFDPYESFFTTTFNLNTIQDALGNYDEVISRVLKFYFRDTDEKKLAECTNSIISISHLIKESKYNDTVKSSLYGFFIDPIPTIQKLSYELMTKDLQLSQQYEKNFRKLSELQQQFDLATVSDKWKQGRITSSYLDSFNRFYVSFCLINKTCLRALFQPPQITLILGIDYLSSLDCFISQNEAPELDAFGNALAEKNRVEILELLRRKGEITIRDIEQELGFTGTNAYYHLSLMIKANMVKTRNQGRTVLYSINKRHFDTVRDMLSKYTE